MSGIKTIAAAANASHDIYAAAQMDIETAREELRVAVQFSEKLDAMRRELSAMHWSAIHADMIAESPVATAIAECHWMIAEVHLQMATIEDAVASRLLELRRTANVLL